MTHLLQPSRIKCLLAAVCLWLLAFPAQAFISYYLEGGIGITQADYRYFRGYSNMDSSGASYNLTAGARFNDNFSVEFSYFDFADAEDRLVTTGYDIPPIDAELSSQLLGLTLVGSWPIKPRWHLYGKFGIGWYDVEADYTVSDSGASYGAENTNADYYWGFGTSYRFNLSYAVNIEYRQFWYNTDFFSDTMNIQGISVGFRRYF